MIKRVVVTRKFYKVVPERVKPTKYTQSPLTGLMTGRRFVPRKSSDRTSIIRITRPFDVNKDNKIDQRDFLKGQIIGRTHRGTNPQKVIVKRYYKKGKAIKSYARRIR